MRSILQHLSIEQFFIRACKPVLLLGALWFAAAQAQVTVTGVTYGTLTNNTDTSHAGLTYREQYAPVNTVTTSLGDYRFDGPVASNIIVRRNTSEAGPNNTTVFYQTSASNSTAPLGQYESSVANMFLSNNLYEGLRNPFANGAADPDTLVAGTPTTYGNMDFMALGATVSRLVPEPSPYGAILLGLTAALLGWRHRRARFSGAQV
jgi:hypothetical protein